MLLYAAALAAMFVCQNGLTRVIQAPPRPRAPRKATSRGPPKKGAPSNPLGPITITTPARPTRWLLLALASIARAGHDSEETYVIQALRPEAIPALDVAVPDGVSRLALSAGTSNSTRVDYAVARNGRRKGVAQIRRLRPSDCAGADSVSLQYRVVEPQSVEGYVGVRLVLFEGSHCEQTATAERCSNDVDLLEQYHSYQFFLDDTSREWKELRVGLCGDEDPRSPFWRLDRFGAAGDGHLDPSALRGWQLKFVGADSSTGVDVTGAVELRELACIGSGLVGSMLERPWAEPAADAPWHAPHAVRAAVADGDVAITYAEPTSYTLSRTLPDDAYFKIAGAVIAYETDATAMFELLDGSEPVSGTGRGSLTVGAADGAHVTGLRLTVDATAAGNTSFTNLRAVDAPDHDHDHAHDCCDSDDARCAHVEGVVLNKRAATRTITFGHRECCQHCLDAPNCTFYSVEAGSGVGTVNDPACYLFDAPTVQRLAEYEADLPTIRTSWILGRERRGELCEVCACTEASADCRGRDLKTVPFADDDAIVSLDLRENPLLAIIPAGAFAGLRALDEVLLPVDVAYVAPDAFAPGVAIVPAAGTEANVVADASEFFASACCGLGTSTGAGGHFCDERVERDAPGADAVFYDGSTFAWDSIYRQITPSSDRFGEAAGSAQLCASYCAMSESCWAFSYSEPKRAMTLLPICRMHTKDALDLPMEDLSDRRQTWTAGVPPRTRKLRGARVVAPRHVEAKHDGEQYRAEFSVSLGAAPTRGAIWVTPEVRPWDGGRPLARATFDPPRIALYDANVSVPVTMAVALPTYSRALGVSFRVVSCDAAFEDVDEAVRVGIPRHADDDDDNSHKHRRRARRTQQAAIIAGAVIGATLLVGCAVAGCWYVNRSLTEKDRLQAERRVTVQQQVGEFQSTFNVISGDAFLALGGLGRDAYYEQQRNAGKLISFDVVAEVEEVKKRDGVVFVFLSHQWLSFGGPDPEGLQYAAACHAVRAVSRRVEADPRDLRIWFDVISVPQKNKALQAFAISSLPTYASTCDVFVVIAPPTIHRDTCVACDEASYRARTWCRAEVMSCWARNGAETMYMCNGDALERFDVNAEALDVFGGGLTCCTRCHPDGVCDKEALVLPMLGLFVELYENRHRDGKVVSLSSLESAGDGAADVVTPDEAASIALRATPTPRSRGFAGLEPLATAARGRPSYATVEPLLERLYPRTFEWTRKTADGATVTEQAPLFGDLIDAVKWYADREEGDAGEPPDFAPGTNARRRTALKKPPARPSRLLSAMSFRSTRSLGHPSPGSAASSRKTPTPSSG